MQKCNNSQFRNLDVLYPYLKEQIKDDGMNIDTLVKYYFTDLGLRNVRLNFRQQEQRSLMLTGDFLLNDNSIDK